MPILRVRMSDTALVFGDLIIDRYIQSNPYMIDQTAAVAYGPQIDEWVSIGGAGNAAIQAAAMGLHVEVVGIQDGRGEAANLLLAHDVNRFRNIIISVSSVPSWQTPAKLRIVDMKHRLLARVDTPRQPLNKADIADMMCGTLRDSIIERTPNTVIISDYNKGVVSHDTCSLLTTMQREYGYQLVIDPHPANAEMYRNYFAGCDPTPIFMPNRAAYEKMTMQAPGRLEDMVRWAPADFQKYRLVVTEGCQGLVVKEPGPNQNPIRIPPIDVTAVDQCGASDAVAAGIAFAMAKPHASTPVMMGRTAAIAGGLAVTKAGTAPVWWHEVYGELLEGRGKRADLELAVTMAKTVRMSGGRVAVTNGVFDLMHEGHRKLLREAGKDNYLIVLLNSDESTKQIKGDDRPVQHWGERADAICDMDCVDLVVAFQGSTPAVEIEAIKPDFLYKDSSREGEDIPGAAHAGEVRFTDKSSHSTSRLIRRIRRDTSG